MDDVGANKAVKSTSINTCYEMMELYGPVLVLRYKLFTSHWLIRAIIQPILYCLICYRHVNGCEAMMGTLMNISTRYCDKDNLLHQVVAYINYDSHAMYRIYDDITNNKIIPIDYTYSELINDSFGRHFTLGVIILFTIFYGYICLLLFLSYDPRDIILYYRNEL